MGVQSQLIVCADMRRCLTPELAASGTQLVVLGTNAVPFYFVRTPNGTKSLAPLLLPDHASTWSVRASPCPSVAHVRCACAVSSLCQSCTTSSTSYRETRWGSTGRRGSLMTSCGSTNGTASGSTPREWGGGVASLPPRVLVPDCPQLNANPTGVRAWPRTGPTWHAGGASTGKQRSWCGWGTCRASCWQAAWCLRLRRTSTCCSSVSGMPLAPRPTHTTPQRSGAFAAPRLTGVLGMCV